MSESGRMSESAASPGERPAAAAGPGDPPAAAPVVIKARENGPYKITGPVTVTDADGNVYDLPDDGRPLALCRCGNSGTKPFCDGTHRRIGFMARERATGEPG